jgi:hypothetical protein
MIFLVMAELAALRVTLTHNPNTASRLMCEFGLLLAGATLVFSFLDPEVRKVGGIKGWKLARMQTVSTSATAVFIALVTLMWRLL